MRLITYLLVVLVLTSSCSLSTTENQLSQPNVLFILVDDLGYSDLGVTGSQFYETPNIDRLANMGSIFVNGYATCSVCSPSRASLLTGQFPARHGITNWIGAKTGHDWKNLNRQTKLLPPQYIRHLPHENVVLPEAFKEQGYATFFAGKWHLGDEANSSLPTDHGFDVNQGGYEKGGPYSGGYFSPFNNPYMLDHENEVGMNLSMKLAKETSSFIEQNKEAPFFAYLSFYAVHAPIQTTKAKWSKYRNKAESMGIHDEGFEMERILPIRKYQDNPVYAGLIEQVDEAVGHVLQTLEDQELDSNTIVVFTSDNGGVSSGDNYSTSHLKLRGGKGYQWEAGIRVPYFIYVPWLAPEHKRVLEPVSGTDFYPTLLDLANIPLKPDQHIDGLSLKPLLEDKGKGIDYRTFYWHYPHYGNQGGEPNSIIKEGNWKLIYYWESNHSELYKIESDRAEQRDVTHEHYERTKEMKTKLLEWLKSVGTQYAARDPSWNKKARAQRLEDFKNVLLPKLEKQRSDMLESTWQPNEDWWGSEVN